MFANFVINCLKGESNKTTYVVEESSNLTYFNTSGSWYIPLRYCRVDKGWKVAQEFRIFIRRLENSAGRGEKIVVAIIVVL